MMADPITFHLPQSQLSKEGRAPFYTRLIDGLRKRGIAVQTVLHDRSSTEDTVAATGGFHIIDHGRLRHPRVLNAGVAYIYPFWHLDPWGIRAFSSITEQHFDPEQVDRAEARRFADSLRQRLVQGRKSRYAQPQPVADLPKGGIAVFLQAEGYRDLAETCHLTQREMLRALIARDDPRPILIKPHPKDFDEDSHRFLRRLSRKDSRVTLAPVNIHDLIAASSVVVTINSATGLEAMMHHKPVILCGAADFHHAAVTVRTAAELDAALTAPLPPLSPDEFLYWYLGQRCLNAQSPDLVDTALARIAGAGFDPSRLLPD